MFNEVYIAIYKYIQSIVDKMDNETDFNKEVVIEVLTYDKKECLLLQKISSDPVSQTFITGDMELLFKFSLKSIQNYIPEDNEYLIKLTQFLDNIAYTIKREYERGNKPIIDNFTSMSINAINNSSNITITDNKAISVIDLEFKYFYKQRRV